MNEPPSVATTSRAVWRPALGLAEQAAFGAFTARARACIGARVNTFGIARNQSEKTGGSAKVWQATRIRERCFERKSPSLRKPVLGNHSHAKAWPGGFLRRFLPAGSLVQLKLSFRYHATP